MPDNQARWRVAFAELLDRDGSSPNDYDAGEEEDPRIYLSGEEEIGRFVCVTTNWSSRGHEMTFYLPTFNDWEAAAARAVEYIQDDLFEEIPLKIVDLETGAEWTAEPAYTWRREKEPVHRTVDQGKETTA